MKHYITLIFLTGIFVSFLSCNSGNNTRSKIVEIEKKNEYPIVIQPDTLVYVVLTDSIRNVLIAQGNQISNNAKIAIKQALQSAIKKNGLEYALEYCKLNALPITDSVSMNEKVQIKRLAKKYRNPLNETSENENRIFEKYEHDLSNGKNLSPIVIVTENKHFVYYSPLLIEDLCLNCHGKPNEQINSELTKRIAVLYPNDKAIDFNVGDLRGMWSITFPDFITDLK